MGKALAYEPNKREVQGNLPVEIVDLPSNVFRSFFEFF